MAQGPIWGDPGVTEQVLIQENPIAYTLPSGGPAVRTLQRAGLMRKLRLYSTMQLNVTANTTGPAKSAFGPMSALARLRVEANGQIPLVDLSGFGALVYNEVINRDGSVLSRPLDIAELNVTDSLKLAQYDAIGNAATGTFNANYIWEFPFGLPVNLGQQITELGLWLLQNQAIDVGVTLTFNPLYAAAATNDAPWSGGTGITAAALAASQVAIERELYQIPASEGAYPVLSWAHQIIEFAQPFTGSFSRFNIPRAGLLLRAIMVNLDASGTPLLVEYSDISTLDWVYGSNEKPISRPGWSPTAEYLMDYNRQPPKGLVVLDFYKWGWEGLKLVKNTEELANLRIETTFKTTTNGTQKVLLDRLVPVVSRGRGAGAA